MGRRLIGDFWGEVLVGDSWNLRGRVSNYRALNLGELGIDKRFISFLVVSKGSAYWYQNLYELQHKNDSLNVKPSRKKKQLTKLLIFFPSNVKLIPKNIKFQLRARTFQPAKICVPAHAKIEPESFFSSFPLPVMKQADDGGYGKRRRRFFSGVDVWARMRHVSPTYAFTCEDALPLLRRYRAGVQSKLS